MADLSGMFGAMDAAIAQGAEPSPAAEQSRPLTIRPGPSVKNTMDAIDAALADEKPAPAPGPKTIPGAAPVLPDTMQAPAPRARPATADQTIPDVQGAGAALDAVEGTGRANYDAGPAEDGLTPMERLKGLPSMGVNALAQAAEGAPLIGAGVNKAAAGLASLVNGRNVADNETTGKAVSDDFEAAHPGVTAGARLAGGIIATAPLMAVAPEAFGIGGGGFLVRGAAGVGSNAAIAGADAAARDEDVGRATAIGGALGALGPVAEGAAVVGGKLVKAADKVAGPIIAGRQIRNLAPGDIEGLLNNPRTAQAAADKLRSFSAEPTSLDARVAAAPDAAVPGTPQTLSMAVGGDMGLYQAEKQARVADNSAFNTVDQQRSAASLDALRGVQSTGDVFAPGRLLRQKFDAIDAEADAAEARLRDSHVVGVTDRANATQAFTADQQGSLAARQADRAQAQQADAVSATGDLAGRVADRTDAAAAQKVVADAQRQAGLDALAQGHAEQEAGLQAAAKDAADALPTTTPEAAGAAFRAAQSDHYATARSARSDLYKAMNPKGDLALVSSPVREDANKILGGINAYAPKQSEDATRLLNTAKLLPDVMPFNDLTSFEQDITQAMAQERRANGESYSYKLMSDLKASTQSAIFNAADNQAAHQARLVAAGQMPFENTMEAQFRQDWGGGDDPAGATSDGQRSTAVAGVRPLEARAGGTSADPATGDASRQGGRGPVAASSDSAISAQARAGSGGVNSSRFEAPAYNPDGYAQAPQRPDVPRPQTLDDFVRSKGGIQDVNGDLGAMGKQRLIAKPGAGLSPDAMREAAAEAGYLGADTTRAMAETHPNDLFAALENGDRTYSVHDYDAVDSWDQHDQAREAFEQTGRGDPGARPAGPRPKAPVSSYAEDDIYAPGTAPNAANGELRPNMTQADVDALAAAKAGHAEFAQTHKNNIVAPVLKTNGYAGQYLTPDSGVMGKVWTSGDKGGDTLRAFLKTTNNDPRALQAIGDYALNGLRAKIGPAGTLGEGDVKRWAAAHEPAIRAMQEAFPGFMDAVSTATAADRTLVAAGLANKAERQAAQAQAAAEALAADEARPTTLRGQNTADRDNTALALAKRREADKAADAADRAGVGAAISDRRASDRAADVQSKADMASGVKQARGMVKAANATPGGQYARTAGSAVAPTEVANTVGSMLATGKAGASRMRGLVQSVEHDPEALAGLRKAGIDYMMERLTNSDGALSEAKAINFLLDNRDTLAELYPHDQRVMFGAIARDAARGKAYADATKVRGSDTAKNAIAFIKDKGPDLAKHGSLMMLAAEAVSQGFERGGVRGALMGGAGAAGLYLANGLRGAGVRGFADLTRAAMSDVKVAQLLLSKAPTATAPQKAYALVGLLRRAAIYGGATMGAQQDPELPALRQLHVSPPPTAPRSGALSAFLGG